MTTTSSETQPQQQNAPERLYVQLTPMGGTISYISRPPDNRRPVYEYVRVDATVDGALKEALKDANELCRSALAIAQRQGIQTNWTAFEDQLRQSLARQHKALGRGQDEQ